MSKFVNLYDRDKAKRVRSGPTRDTAQHIGAPPPPPKRTADHETCNRCRGSRGGPNAFVPERTCKACGGLGYVAVST